jgi:cell wall-associated NlpC family hydrolase
MTYETSSLQEIKSVIASRERFNVLTSIAISAAIIAGAVLFLFYAAYLLQDSAARLKQTQTELAQRQAELAKTAQATVEAKAVEAKLQTEIASARSDAERANAEKARLQSEVVDAQAHVARANAEVARLSAAAEEANRTIKALEEKIRSSTDYAQHLHHVGWEEAKYLYGTSNRLGALLEKILALRDRKVPFNLANTVEQGFTSPGFAAYILGQLNIVPPGTSQQTAIERLPRTDMPKPGDLVLYRGGFAMFYFEDHQRRPFVIGMTPAGIAALQPDFGVPRVEVRRTGIL